LEGAWQCAPALLYYPRPCGHALFLRCRKALRFSFIAGRRFAFPPLPEGASLFLHCRKALRFSSIAGRRFAFPAYLIIGIDW